MKTVIANLTSLIRSYFSLDGHHIQFNVIDAETLKDAQKHPERYRDLIVRVAGYSDYFNDLGEDLQNEIIARTEHEEMSRPFPTFHFVAVFISSYPLSH